MLRGRGVFPWRPRSSFVPSFRPIDSRTSKDPLVAGSEEGHVGEVRGRVKGGSAGGSLAFPLAEVSGKELISATRPESQGQDQRP